MESAKSAGKRKRKPEPESEPDDTEGEDMTESESESEAETKASKRHRTDDYRADTAQIETKYREKKAKADGVQQRTKTRTKYRQERSETMSAPKAPSAPKPFLRQNSKEVDYEWAIHVADTKSLYDTMKVSLANLEDMTIHLQGYNPSTDKKNTEGIRILAKDMEQAQILTKTTFGCKVYSGIDAEGNPVDVNSVSVMLNAQALLEVLHTMLQTSKSAGLVICKVTPKERPSSGSAEPMSGNGGDDFDEDEAGFGAQERVCFEAYSDGSTAFSRMHIPILDTTPQVYPSISVSSSHRTVNFARVETFRQFVEHACKHQAEIIEFKFSERENADGDKTYRLQMRYEGGTETAAKGGKVTGKIAGIGQTLVIWSRSNRLSSDTVHDTDVVDSSNGEGFRVVYRNYIKTLYLHPFVKCMTNNSATLQMMTKKEKPFVFLYKTRTEAKIQLLIAHMTVEE